MKNDEETMKYIMKNPEDPKPFYKKAWFWIAIVIILAILFSSSGNQNTNTNTNTSLNSNSNENTTTTTSEGIDTIIYDDNDIIIKITGYEYHSISDYLEVSIYIENNSKQDINITIDGDASVDGYTLDTYFYETVNAETKSNTSFSVHDLYENGLNGDSLKSIKFKFDIYHSDNYLIDERIEDDLEISYEF